MGRRLIQAAIVAVSVTVGAAWHSANVRADHPPSTTLPPATPVTTTTVDQSLIEKWGKVAVCESGGWVVLGSAYPNSLGITAANWQQFGGTEDVSPWAQVQVAERFRAYYGIEIPDQNGCGGAW